MPLQRREPDAIDLWFTMQRKAWWKKWKWLVVGFALIAVWHTLRFFPDPGPMWLTAHPPELNFVCPVSEKVRLTFLFWSKFHYFLHDLLIVPAVLIPLTLAGYLVFPSELVAAVGFPVLQQRKRAQVRKATWFTLAALMVFPLVLSAFFINGFLALLSWVVIFTAIVEWIVFCTTKQFSNWAVVLNAICMIAVFILLRVFLLLRMRGFWETWSVMGIGDSPVGWISLYPIAIAALVSLVALVFLVRANKAPVEYQVEG